MRITSVRISLLVLVALTLAACASVSEEGIRFGLPNAQEVTIFGRAGNLMARITGQQAPMAMGASLQHRIAAADSLLLITTASFPLGTGQGVVAVARVPSSTNPMGYCGAGHEDYLVLIKVTETQLLLLDEHLVQSCVGNLSIETESGDNDPQVAIAAGQFPIVARFDSLTAPGDERRALQARIEADKIVIEPAAARQD